MSYRFPDIATTASVRAVREDMGSAQVWERFEGDRAPDSLTQHETDFIAARDHFYMASVSQSGWPYVQHRGGPRGFLTVLDAATLAFADYRGNRQYISVGNMRANARVALILMDYANRTRLKIFATVELLPVDAESDLAGRVLPQDYRARTERIVLLHVVAFDWNCPQHITQRFTEDEIIETMRDVNERLVGLEDENARLRGELALARSGVANP
ncbi:pyridoxamine 5'-phosphate oxidase-related, FMN-binding protein [Maricaulis maris MCS10]|uniref:Pyridoxamine 5'-phosphate oxidase-related, FMN-binding protein n=1 Tax=Maricaulis maris (strain MCS10) TaxID=394221 RepID=Q0AQF5_MARMM|nr:pyridoxamine 5'-phosphate oxidase family protein [Maricaulis maris]ABI65482.1 pyridoxamine 5'-phosphate oxidase-related, FMN-binding protein [Maricaulis maris MCS10]